MKTLPLQSCVWSLSVRANLDAPTTFACRLPLQKLICIQKNDSETPKRQRQRQPKTPPQFYNIDRQWSFAMNPKSTSPPVSSVQPNQSKNPHTPTHFPPLLYRQFCQCCRICQCVGWLMVWLRPKLWFYPFLSTSRGFSGLSKI